MPARFLRQRLPVMLATVLLLTSTAHSSDDASTHPLVGQIRDIAQKNFIDRAELAQRLSSVEYLLLGERHDNPVHHRHQAWFLDQLARHHDSVSVAFEMIDQQQGEALVGQTFDSADKLIQLLDQHPNGWEYSTYYRDLFATSLEHGYHIRAANLNRQDLRNILRADESIDAAYRQLLDTTAWSETQDAALKQEIDESHCNMVNSEMIRMMSRAQRLRDAVMARTMLDSQTSIKVLVAGNGHVRNDRGVPIYLNPKPASILSIGFIEVDQQRRKVSDYSLPFDIAWFTPPVEREDPCESFRRQMRNKASATQDNGS